jgi:hypothetical protein
MLLNHSIVWDMKKTTYQIEIAASAAKVSETMIDKSSYEKWTSAFNPSSTFEGNWEKGSKILFVGIDEEGKKGGMVAEIADHIPHQFISIRHRGLLEGENEITEGPAVEGWAGALENYSFKEENGKTTVVVEVDTNENYLDYFDQTWPKALAKLKEICEN